MCAFKHCNVITGSSPSSERPDSAQQRPNGASATQTQTLWELVNWPNQGEIKETAD